jgi:hypothetical protein
MIKLKDKKAKMEISVLLLVIVTLILVIYSISAFYLRASKISSQLTSYEGIDEIYSSSERYTFNLRNIGQEVVNGGANDEGTFISGFKSELSKYFNNNEKLFLVEEYAFYSDVLNLLNNPKNYDLIIENNSIIFKIKNIEISNNFKDKDNMIKSISYSWDVLLIYRLNS